MVQYRSVIRWWLPALLISVVLITVMTGWVLRGPAMSSGGDYSVTFFILLYVNLFLALALGVLVVRNFLKLWSERRRKQTGARLRARMVMFFVALSLLPTLVIALLSAELLNRGVDAWFSDRIAQALDHSLDLARSYYGETQRTIRHDAEDIARNHLVTSALALGDRGKDLDAVLEVERDARDLDEIAIIRADGARIARAGELPFDPLPDFTALVEAVDLENRSVATDALLVTNDTGDRVRAFISLGEDRFLSVGRWIGQQVLGQMEAIEAAYVDYHQLRAAHGLLKTTHTVTLVFIALLLLIAAVWSGFLVADRITDPIARLVVGTRQVASGDLSVTMPVSGDDELATLMASFNAMTHTLGANRKALNATNMLLKERRRSIEAIVSNISAGVISVNRMHRITLINPVAEHLLSIQSEKCEGLIYTEVLSMPNLRPLLTLLRRVLVHSRYGGVNHHSTVRDTGISQQLTVHGSERARTLLVHVMPLENSQGMRQGFVVTFDDLTEVILAQRAHAWSEVARRIAHEIKNPLTPIQLSAQRMRRKYLHPQNGTLLEKNGKVLNECTDTIIKQVEELRVLVNEFSNFARMPRAGLKKNDLNQSVEEVLILHKANMKKKVSIQAELSPDLPPVQCDHGQIKQVITNLIANAMASVQEQPEEEGQIVVKTLLSESGDRALLQIADNGPGIPPEKYEEIFQPYFTTKPKGTGLGLAIVKKIIEDHRGVIHVNVAPQGGALFEVALPLSERAIDTRRDVSDFQKQFESLHEPRRDPVAG